MDIINTTPDIILFFLFIFIVVILSCIGLFLMELIFFYLCVKPCVFKHTKTYILIVSSLIAIVLAFIIYNEWQAFYRAQLNTEEESTALHNLYKMVSTLPNTHSIKKQIIKYIKSIIYVEFPLLKQNKMPPNNIVLNKLQTMIYNYNPKNNRETQLYQELVVSMNRAVNLRTARIDSALNGLAPELWWVVLLGTIINIILTWFITGPIYFKMLMTSFVATIFASLLFILIVLDYPFSGEYSINAKSFQLVLDSIQ